MRCTTLRSVRCDLRAAKTTMADSLVRVMRGKVEGKAYSGGNSPVNVNCKDFFFFFDCGELFRALFVIL